VELRIWSVGVVVDVVCGRVGGESGRFEGMRRVDFGRVVEKDISRLYLCIGR
jgi:hypothetical protein